MVKHTCEICNKIFEKKSHFIQHLNKKKPCGPLISKKNLVPPKIPPNSPQIPPKNPLISNDKNTCMYCFKKYSRTDHLKRHLLKNCKIKRESDIEKENIFKLLLEKDKQNKQNKIEIDELKNQNKILIDKINKLISLKEHSKSKKTINNKTIINQTNNQTNNNQTNNIVMVNFGKEDLSIIDKKIFLDRVVKNRLYGVKVPEEILKIIHFNPNYPQLSNIYISDINREKYMIFEDGEWKLSPIDKIPEVIEKVALYSNNLDGKLYSLPVILEGLGFTNIDAVSYISFNFFLLTNPK